MELRVGFAEMTLDRFNFVCQDSEEGFGGYHDIESNGEAVIPYVFPDMEVECVLEHDPITMEDKCIIPALKN